MHLATLAGLGGVLIGCVSCNAELRTAILEHRFLVLLSTIVPLTLAGGFLAAWSARMVVPTRNGVAPLPLTRLAWAGAMIGAGTAGLFDSILLHQILQVHDMVSNSLPPVTFLAKSVNVFWSGLFDLAVLALVLLGIRALLAARQEPAAIPPRFFWGAFLFGSGIFNCIDTVVFHGVLRYHDVVEVTAGPLAWNIGWGLMGAAIALAGALVMRTAARSSAAALPRSA